ncbi:MAG: hypothetical protein HQL76_06245 [Magnetococcales bacterium]|nr:hypothetical protein [Magnetococcales bacterium]
MVSQANNFKFYRGDTKVFTLSFAAVAGTPIDITGHELWFTMKHSPNDPDVAAVLQKRIVFPATPESVAGAGSLTLHSTETAVIEPGVYFYDMQKVIPGIPGEPNTPPVVATLISGRIQVLPDITQRCGSSP